MPRRRNETDDIRQALTPEGRMLKLTKKAFDLAERQLDDGTIAPSTLNALLRYGTVENELQLEGLRAKNKLNDSKVALIDSEVKGKGDSQEVINAIRGYMPSEEFNVE
ncbi:MAG: hypothetical protein HXM02_06175 [[Eubacterium] sulci]|jgi:hypothetical protein|nr:hypothetical protein [[Eubacterium] sulci]DAM71636.1 MAG TPA: hypothetical protein [Caudoviricetes sp.]DAO53756.1 MAG TPA: hypothetical protein [Caudoviricetes sp.]DAV42792.1 MAG TPA: hypothetical protein [Caudoviricetes sp.]DAW03682.1 MAG TPA: hypothetical protein [Caudoviricetes sp.]